jgi:hypothetical protein
MIRRPRKECGDTLKVESGVNPSANFVRSGLANGAERH